LNLLVRLLLALGLFSLGTAAGGYVAWHYELVPRPVAAEPGDAPPRTWEATVYLPSKDRQGNRLKEEEVRQALDDLVTRFEGATLDQPREGRWHDSKQQRVQSESVTPVAISFDRHRLAEFRQAVRALAAQLRQDAVYVRFEEPRVELIGPAEKTQE
jgi:hypothetical protein